MLRPAAPVPPIEDPRAAAGWEGVLAAVMGVILLGFGWADARSFLASRHKTPFTFSVNAFPGGARMGVAPGKEFFRDPAGDYARLENFTPLEHRGGDAYRHNLGPVSSLEIVAPGHSRARLSFRYGNNTDDQGFTVDCNGEILEQIDHLPPGEIVRAYMIDLYPGGNVVTFTCRRYNHDGTLDLPGESRPVAGTFGALDVLLE